MGSAASRSLYTVENFEAEREVSLSRAERDDLQAYGDEFLSQLVEKKSERGAEKEVELGEVCEAIRDILGKDRGDERGGGNMRRQYLKWINHQAAIRMASRAVGLAIDGMKVKVKVRGQKNRK